MNVYRQPFANEWPITQRYGDKFTSNFHTGIDYGCPFGTPVLASSDGIVVFAGWDKTGYGNFVIVYHNVDHSTCYAHLSDISVVLNRKVRQGELLGHSGNTGNSTGPHLHFEARKTWYDYRSHFDPFKLPLTSVYDSPMNDDTNGLIDSFEEGPVEVVAPAGALGHNKNFSSKKTFPFGSRLTFTGETIERNGLTFCKCYDEVWIAANDGETQILKNV